MQPEGAHAWGQTKTVSPSIRKSNENTRGNYTCVLIVNMVRHTENAPGHALHLTTAASSGSAMFSLKCPVCVSSPLSNAHDLCATLDRFYRPWMALSWQTNNKTYQHLCPSLQYNYTTGNPMPRQCARKRRTFNSGRHDAVSCCQFGPTSYCKIRNDRPNNTGTEGIPDSHTHIYIIYTTTRTKDHNSLNL